MIRLKNISFNYFKEYIIDHEKDIVIAIQGLIVLGFFLYSKSQVPSLVACCYEDGSYIGWTISGLLFTPFLAFFFFMYTIYRIKFPFTEESALNEYMRNYDIAADTLDKNLGFIGFEIGFLLFYNFLFLILIVQILKQAGVNFKVKLIHLFNELTNFILLMFLIIFIIFCCIFVYYMFKKSSREEIVQYLHLGEEYDNLGDLKFFEDISAKYNNFFLVESRSKLPEDLKLLWNGKSGTIILIISILSFFFISTLGFYYEIITISSFIIALCILPFGLIVSRLTGKYFGLFTINQISKAKKWDMMKGERIFEGLTYRDYMDSFLVNIFNNIKELITLIISIILLPVIFISFIAPFLNLLNFILGNWFSNKISISQQLINYFFVNDHYFIGLIILSTGPLLVLLLKPFAFVDMWLNQGIYDLIGSGWKDTIIEENRKRYGKLFHTSTHYGFQRSLFFATISILFYLGLRMFVSLEIQNTSELVNLKQAFKIIDIVVAVVFILSVFSTFFERNKLRSVWIHAREGRKHNIHLLQKSLAGIALSEEEKDMEKFINGYENVTWWSHAFYLKGKNTYYSIEERISALKSALDPDKVLLPTISEEVNLELEKLGYKSKEK